MYPAPRPPGAGPPAPPAGPGQLKFTIAETCDRIKEEFNFLQSQYHTLKLECEKLASEKTEMQRHYVMYYEMSYGLNVEMHKQTEIAKRLNAIIAQVLPFLSQEHQQQVATAVERAKQVTMTELNAIIGQQMHAQAGIPHGAHAPTLPMAPHPSLAGMPGLPPSSAAPPGLLSAVSSASLMGLPTHPLSVLGKPDLGRSEDKRERPDDRASSLLDERARNSTSPGEKYRPRSRTPDDHDSKRRKEDKSHDSDGEKSDQDLVVDVANEMPSVMEMCSWPQSYWDVVEEIQNGARRWVEVKLTAMDPLHNASSHFNFTGTTPTPHPRQTATTETFGKTARRNQSGRPHSRRLPDPLHSLNTKRVTLVPPPRPSLVVGGAAPLPRPLAPPASSPPGSTLGVPGRPLSSPPPPTCPPALLGHDLTCPRARPVLTSRPPPPTPQDTLTTTSGRRCPATTLTVVSGLRLSPPTVFPPTALPESRRTAST